ncbi:MAG: cupin domain-containing protein [Bacilli bacterium]
MQETDILRNKNLHWQFSSDHVALYQKTLLDPQTADALRVAVSTILWERIEVSGGVLPHYHDVAEIIHITRGRVKVLCNGEWLSCQSGDTLRVPSGVVHSVMNDDAGPTEQISVFLPTTDDGSPPNRPFETVLVEEGRL